ncbi:multidrug ABC transporter ATP-binding protein [Mesoplasma coleopterae]|uniref:ABC transporter ATP-binding protein n=1 Tax=Mesoplasma coleopterae TaxID=324078 RepID=UPI000D03C07B|nr:ABC transporter ATP-binding protein [Mesoplasma coleopterae]AVN62647.1 multidrug ABC transporter ATP-binding protein [Mesoplasma coleopterae]
MTNIIEIKNLKKAFKNKVVLDNLNLDIKEGERVAIMGANGCGKTTLVEMIAQFNKPDKGSIKINLEGNIKNEIGIQLQTGDWPAGITPLDMLAFYRSIYPKFTKDWENKIADVFDIKEFIKTPLKKLSGGQKQRFNAMISVMNNPKIVILDELTTGLDMELQYKITDFFRENVKKSKQTLLLVSHHPEEVEILCNRILIVKDGDIFFDKKINEVIKKYGSVRDLMNLFFKGELK